MIRDQQPWWGAEGEERFLHSEKQGKQLGQKRTFGRSEGNAATSLWKTGQSKNCVHGPCHRPAHLSLSHVSLGAERGWVLESRVWRADPGRGQLLAVKRQPEGTGLRSSTTGKVCGRSPGHHRSKVPLLSGAQGVGPTLQPPLPTHRPLPLWALRGAPI